MVSKRLNAQIVRCVKVVNLNKSFQRRKKVVPQSNRCAEGFKVFGHSGIFARCLNPARLA